MSLTTYINSKSTIASILMSVPEGITIPQLLTQYKEIEGKEVPFEEMG